MKYYNNYEDLSKLKVDEIYKLKFSRTPYGEELIMEVVVKITNIDLNYTLKVSDLSLMADYDKPFPEEGIQISLIIIMSNDVDYLPIGFELTWINISDNSYFEDLTDNEINNDYE